MDAGGHTEVPNRKAAARKASERAMLEAAAEMLWESPVGDIFSDLKPVDIARRANPSRTTGSFYNIWPTQDAFREAFVRYLLSLDQFRAERDARYLINDLLRSPDFDFGELIRVGGNKYFDGLKGEKASMRIQLALWTKADSDARIRERLKALYDDVARAMIPLYEMMLTRAGRRLRPGYSVQDLAMVLAALAEGMHIRWSIDHDAVPENLGAPPDATPENGRPWGAFASVAHIIVIGMTEPVG
jgi:hypothetical protein